jgi:hypothetical protein
MMRDSQAGDLVLTSRTKMRGSPLREERHALSAELSVALATQEALRAFTGYFDISLKRRVTKRIYSK